TLSVTSAGGAGASCRHPSGSIPRVTNASSDWISERMVVSSASPVESRGRRLGAVHDFRGVVLFGRRLEHLLGGHLGRVVANAEPVVINVHFDQLDTWKPIQGIFD